METTSEIIPGKAIFVNFLYNFLRRVVFTKTPSYNRTSTTATSLLYCFLEGVKAADLLRHTFYFSFVLLFYCFIVLLFYCFIFLFYCSIVLLFYCSIVLLFYCSIVLLFYCFIVLLFYCLIFSLRC